jgi:hypothetical protein
MHHRRRLLFFDTILMIVLIFLIIDDSISLIVKHKLIEQVHSGSNGKYDLTIGKFHLDILTGSVTATNVLYSPTDKTSTSVKAGRVEINHVKILDLLRDKKIVAGSIVVNNSFIIVKPEPPKQDAEPADSGIFTIYDIFKNNYHSVSIGEININDPFIRFYKNKSDSSLFLTSTSGNIHIVNFTVDSSTVNRLNKPFRADSVDVVLRKIKNIVGDSLYTLTADVIKLSYARNSIDIQKLSLKPNFDRKDFFRRVGEQTDRFVLTSSAITMKGIPVKRFVENGECLAQFVTIDSLNVKVYRDKYVKLIRKKKKFLQEIIHGVDLPLKIDTLEIKNAFVQYEELLPPSKKPGKLAFHHINATILTVSNFKYDSMMTFTATAKLNNRSPLKTSIQFPLKVNRFNGETFIRNVDMKQLNSMLEGTSNASITNGIIDSLRFEITADPRSASGHLRMIYHDLRIVAKDIEKNDTSAAGLKIKSFIINQFVIKDSNPEKGKDIRKVSMQRPYNNEKFMINNLWKTLLQGIQMTIGVPAKK